MNCTMEVTPEKAKELLKNLQSLTMYPQEYVAIDMAIEALDEYSKLQRVGEYICSIAHDKQSQSAEQIIYQIEKIIWPHLCSEVEE